MTIWFGDDVTVSHIITRYKLKVSACLTIFLHSFLQLQWGLDSLIRTPGMECIFPMEMYPSNGWQLTPWMHINVSRVLMIASHAVNMCFTGCCINYNGNLQNAATSFVARSRPFNPRYFHLSLYIADSGMFMEVKAQLCCKSCLRCLMNVTTPSNTHPLHIHNTATWHPHWFSNNKNSNSEVEGGSPSLWMTDRWAWLAHAPQMYCFFPVF